MPDHLSAADDGVRTAQVITPGNGCPSEDFLGRTLAATGRDWLYVTSANRSRHLTGAANSPAHWRAAGLWAEFSDEPGFVLLGHDDEEQVASRYPGLAPTSTSVLALHRTVRPPTSARPHLVLERHGSLPAEVVREVLDGLGLGLVLAPAASRRLAARRCAEAVPGPRSAQCQPERPAERGPTQGRAGGHPGGQEQDGGASARGHGGSPPGGWCWRYGRACRRVAPWPDRNPTVPASPPGCRCAPPQNPTGSAPTRARTAGPGQTSEKFPRAGATDGVSRA